MCSSDLRTFLPISLSEDANPRPRLVVITTFEGTNRMRGFFDRRSARALSPNESASFKKQIERRRPVRQQQDVGGRVQSNCSSIKQIRLVNVYCRAVAEGHVELAVADGAV